MEGRWRWERGYLVSEEEHGSARIIQLVHCIEIWDCLDVNQVYHCKVLDALTHTCQDLQKTMKDLNKMRVECEAAVRACDKLVFWTLAFGVIAGQSADSINLQNTKGRMTRPGVSTSILALERNVGCGKEYGHDLVHLHASGVVIMSETNDDNPILLLQKSISKERMYCSKT